VEVGHQGVVWLSLWRQADVDPATTASLHACQVGIAGC
jgi:hypothetical protein